VEEDDWCAAALLFRRFALDHPALFEIAFQRVDPVIRPRYQTAAVEALAALMRRFEALAAVGMLGERSVSEAVTVFDGLCEGMASLELRGLCEGDGELLWRNAVWALLTGFAATDLPKTSTPSAGDRRRLAA
jgi:hypothetical protein